MALGDFIYPPILSSSQPAINKDNNSIVIPFTISTLTNKEKIKNIGITIVNQSNNISVVKSSKGDGILYFEFSPENYNIIDEATGSYSITINKNKDLYTDEKTAPAIYKAGNLYKVQMRFGQSELQTADDDYQAWKKQESFSDWSSVMLIKPVTPPVLSLNSMKQTGSLSDIFTNIKPIENSPNPTFTGTCRFKTEYDEKESEAYYKFMLYTGEKVLEDSGWLSHQTSLSYDNYTIKNSLSFEKSYAVEYMVKTNNGYIQSTGKKEFELMMQSRGKLDNASITTSSDNENACINLYITTTEVIKGNFILTRASEKTNYQAWETLGYLSTTFNGNNQLIYQDYTIESGIKYLYALTEEVRYSNYTNYKSPLYEGGANFNSSYARCVNFEYAFLYSQGKQLKLKFNNKMSSFKKTILASKSDTIGSRYPTILRNGQAYYAEFPITGLISLQMDDNQTFFTLGEKGYYYDDELIISKDKLQNRSYRKSTNSDQSCSPWTSTDLVDDNIFIERKFREKVEEFLNNGECKLYRSPTEGNITISLLNVSFTPNQTLGRMIYEFNATAYETGETTPEALENLNILDRGEYIYDAKGTTKEFGQVYLQANASYAFKEDEAVIEFKITAGPSVDSVYYKVNINGQDYLLNSRLDFIVEHDKTELTIKSDSEILIDFISDIENKEPRPEEDLVISEGVVEIFGQIVDSDKCYSIQITYDAVSQVLNKLIGKKIIDDKDLVDLDEKLEYLLNKTKYRILDPQNNKIIKSKQETKDSNLYKYINYFNLEVAENTKLTIAPRNESNDKTNVTFYIGDTEQITLVDTQNNMAKITGEIEVTPNIVNYKIKIKIQEVV